MKLKYTGQSHFREVAAADFKSLGVEDQNQVKIARHDIEGADNWRNYKTEVEVSDAAGAKLLELEPTEWAEVTEEGSSDGNAAPVNDEENSSAPNASDAPAGSPDTVPAPTRRTAGGSSTRTR